MPLSFCLWERSCWDRNVRPLIFCDSKFGHSSQQAVCNIFVFYFCSPTKLTKFKSEKIMIGILKLWSRQDLYQNSTRNATQMPHIRRMEWTQHWYQAQETSENYDAEGKRKGQAKGLKISRGKRKKMKPGRMRGYMTFRSIRFKLCSCSWLSQVWGRDGYHKHQKYHWLYIKKNQLDTEWST